MSEPSPTEPSSPEPSEQPEPSELPEQAEQPEQAESLGPRPTADQILQLGAWFYMFMAIGGVAWLWFDLGDIPLTRFVNPASWWIDLALGAGVAVLMVGTWQVLLWRVQLAQKLEDRLMGILGPLTWDQAIVLALISGFAEELLFRGAIQPSLGWIAATLLFALLHTGPGKELRFWTVYALIAGLIFAGLMEWRGNILAPVVAHFVVNAVGLIRLGRRASVAS